MKTVARAARHPIHPMLVPIPIGLWLFSLAADLVVATGHGNVTWRDMALYTMAGGTLGALVAAVPGLIDYVTLTDTRARSIGAFHLVINLVIVALYAVNLWLRVQGQGNPRLPFILSVAAVTLLLISGWLGGELVYRLGVAVDLRPARSPADASFRP